MTNPLFPNFYCVNRSDLLHYLEEFARQHQFTLSSQAFSPEERRRLSTLHYISFTSHGGTLYFSETTREEGGWHDESLHRSLTLLYARPSSPIDPAIFPPVKGALNPRMIQQSHLCRRIWTENAAGEDRRDHASLTIDLWEDLMGIPGQVLLLTLAGFWEY